MRNIYWIENTQKWLVQIKYRKKVYYLGTFDIYNDAFKALIKFKRKKKI